MAFAAMAGVAMGQAKQSAGAAAASAGNVNFNHYIFIILGAVVGGMMLYRILMEGTKYARKITSMNNDTQKYFAYPNMTYAKFKKHFLYAPIAGTRHNKEIQLTKAINVGTLPTRFQLLFITGYFATNITFCVLTIEWGTATAAQELRNRTGILSMVNMVWSFEQPMPCTLTNR